MSRPKSAFACALAVLAALSACERRNQGISAENAGIYFPAALTLDPRVPEDATARWLFVANANSNLAYNAGSLVAVDLDRFFDAWMNCPKLCLHKVDDGTCSAAAKEDPCGIRASVQDIGADVDAETPCRHAAFRPQVIECEDTQVIAHVDVDGDDEADKPLSVRMGSFITALAGWNRSAKEALLLATVKADPSVTWIELRGGLEPFDPKRPLAPTDLSFECGQGTTDLFDSGRCARSGDDSHALRYPFDDGDNARIGPEPSNILVSKLRHWAFVTFATTPEVVLIDLAFPVGGQLPANPDATGGEETTSSTSSTSSTGDTSTTDATTDATTTDATTTDASGTSTTGAPPEPEPVPPGTKPMIVDARSVFLIGDSFGGGGWGMAERPCVPGSAEVPNVTKVPVDAEGEPVDCGRPLIYSSFRTGLFFARLTPDEALPTEDQVCIGDPRLDAEGNPIDAEGNRIDAPEPVLEGEPGALLCTPQIFSAGFTSAVGFTVPQGSGQMGDIAFSRDGRRLFAVQSSPGALLFVDTSVDARGETRDESAGLVELCSGPSRMALFEDGANEYAAVSCPTPGEVFIVDLSGFRVVANVATGAGPHPVVVDRARQLLYVGNTLDATVSVIDIARDRPTRFAEIARVGLQTPYKR
ncbi:YncE family protein [Nannocystis punicea]|uniref:YncE family protein n=1 Tax=Nannocystis punicea TaxID=2995304 RepID=A0ABY7GSJ5_9BACT|nr:hypothetical protein [Nannocystis poenicansa]WAS89924.1 hypothetical protein O0S08_27335 [Nannocystis poenicansa]